MGLICLLCGHNLKNVVTSEKCSSVVTSTCLRCGKVSIKKFPENHKFETSIVKTISPCESELVDKCSRCGLIEPPRKHISHTYSEKDTIVIPIQCGNKIIRTCKNCGYEEESRVYKHSYLDREWVVTDYSGYGRKESRVRCVDCGKVEVLDTKNVYW